MKKYSFSVFLFLFLMGTTLVATAQSETQNFHTDIAYASLNKQSNLASVFNLLASNNNKNVNSLHLQLDLSIRYTTVRTNSGETMLSYTVYNKKMSGDIFFRDFRIDSLLLPEKLNVELITSPDSHPSDTIKVLLSLAGGKLMLPSDKDMPISETAYKMQLKQIDYTHANYQRFLQTAGLINNYYGYLQIMKSLPRMTQQISGAHPVASHVFINYIILNRLENYIQWHNFSDRLHLQKHDPLDFLHHLDEVSHLKTRMKTLSQQLLNGNPPDDREDEQIFERGYVAISIKAVNLSEEQQPYIAASFNEFGRIFPNTEEKTFIQQVLKYYEQAPKQQAGSRKIYQYFIDASSLKIRQKSFVRALDFLSDAAYLEYHFPAVKRIPEFDSCLVHARDGLATSYLKVARMAAGNNDLQLARRYRIKAAESLHAYSASIPPTKTKLCYPHYSSALFQMAKNKFSQAQYQKTLSLIQAAGNACPHSAAIDSLHIRTCERLFNQRVAVSQSLARQDSLVAACDTLYKIAKYYPRICPDIPKSGQDTAITHTAGIIFQHLITKSSHLQRQSQNIEAITCLNMAGHLQKAFSLPHSDRMDSLLSTITVPYILAVADKADLEIWKMNFQKADSIYHLSQNLSKRYGVTENPKVKTTLAALSSKIRDAECQWKQEKMHQLLTQTRQEISAYQMASAQSYYLRAEKLHLQLKGCNEDKPQTDSLFRSFQRLFQFTDAYHQLTLELFNKGFDAVLPGFARLEEEYQTDRLQQFGLPFVDLYTFIKNQHSEELTLKAVHYFIQEKKFKEALRYLQLSKRAATAKTEQKQIALGFAENNITPKNTFLTKPEWNYFAKSYQKALSAKEK